MKLIADILFQWEILVFNICLLFHSDYLFHSFNQFFNPGNQ